ncbi:unnamed protein product [Adineta steineri]|uniref:Uncharacterized protein n=1 Tax=Adineta steineri TaxID=433720 RepID=A0A820H6A3_9BILA|nr:unnamed protein product [Adineta steineri]
MTPFNILRNELRAFQYHSWELIIGGAIIPSIDDQASNRFDIIREILYICAQSLITPQELILKQALLDNNKSKKDMQQAMNQFWNLYDEEVQTRFDEVLNIRSNVIYLILNKI